jgi:methionyl-tRNA synthetase
MPARRQILVSSALPYANGPIHIGHLVEYVQTDIWVRYQRLAGHDVAYVCASDAHGTPIMLKAREQGVTPEALVERYRAEHRRDFAAFHVAFDNYHSTHSPENRALTEAMFATLDAGGHITRRSIVQAYDAEAGMFLPDRFVRGTCPNCGTPDQYGDSCEACGATYSPTDLKDARSVVSGTTPVQRESEHLFFRLGNFTDSLKAWHAAGHVDDGVARKLAEWFGDGLKDWDISRDAPYFGFEIPGHPGKYFYVWLDAPVGYMASFRNLCDSPAGRARGLDFDAYWRPAAGAGASTELYHFIGKDILYFHTLFWPALLEGAGFRRPSAVYVHGFLTVNGQKMSKSRGTFIAAATWLRHVDPEALRYYYAVKLGPGLDDLDLNLDDFIARVNADLVGKFINLASRCAGILQRNAGGRLAAALDRPGIHAELVAAGDRIGEYYAAREYGKACREIMALADSANRYIDERKPWTLAKDPARTDEVRAICTTGINLFRLLMTYLQPVLPAMAGKACGFLGVADLPWALRADPLLDRALNPYEPLLTRIEPAAIAALLEASMEQTPAQAPPAAKASSAAGPAGPAEIDLAEFQKVDLRIATVLAAETVDGADKLVRLTLDIGTGTRTVLSGIKAAYPPEKLVGRQVILVANLKPRKMRFGVSEGMVLAASGDAGLFLVGPDAGATAGMQVS